MEHRADARRPRVPVRVPLLAEPGRRRDEHRHLAEHPRQHEVQPEPCRQINRVEAHAATNPQREARLLERSGLDRDVLKRPAPGTGPRDVLLFEQGDQQFEVLCERFPRSGRGHAHRVVGADQDAAPDRHLDSPTRELIDSVEVLGKPERILRRQQRDAGVEP